MERSVIVQAREQDTLGLAAERIIAASALGRSSTLRKLFDYLIERTRKDEAPKELEVAADVFGRPDSDVITDASVRVYVHRLRRKLEEYYEQDGRDEASQLVLPKGEYRFQLIERRAPVDAVIPEVAPSIVPARRGLDRWLFLLAGLLIGAVVVATVLHFASRDALSDLRASAIWRPMIEDVRPLTIVPGDYYLIGERTPPAADPARLVREFSINSREELAELLMHDPTMRDRYVDLNLFYLPVSTGYAMNAILPIVTPRVAAGKMAAIIPSSKLVPPRLKDGNLVYVGLLSGLGLLREPTFANSRFALGGSYDEILDLKTGKAYVADPPSDAATPRRNYALVSMMPGPNGNRIMIVAGTRDPAVLQAADILTSPDTLKDIEKVAPDGYFEALYAVDGVGDENLRGTLIAAAPRATDGIWDAVIDSEDGH